MSLAAQLYRLQQLEIALDGNRQELGQVERELTDDKSLLAPESELISSEQHLDDARKKQKSCEWELEDIQEKVKGLSKRLYSGATRNPKELVSIEADVKGLKANISRKEDGLLLLMSQVEDLEAEVKARSERLVGLRRDWQERREVLERRKAEIDAELARLGGSRDGLLQQIDPEVLRLYGQIKETRGQAVAKVEGGRCQGCHIGLPTSQWQRVRVGDLIQCHSCGKILYLE